MSDVQPEIDPIRLALEDLVRWYASRGVTRDDKRCLYTMGLPVMEKAFAALGWSEPHPFSEDACATEGCTQWATCWTENIGHCSAHYQSKEPLS
jgi:hypothetical protein